RCHEAVQGHLVVEYAGCPCHGARPGAYVSRERIGEDCEVRRVPDGTPHREGQPAPCAQNSTHFLEASDTIRKELDTLLTEDDIEDSVLERQSRGIAGSPFDGRPGGTNRCRAGRFDHACVEIDTDYPTFRPKTAGGQARDKPRPAGDVENVLSW